MSYNCNPTGRNQYGPAVKANNPNLLAALDKYHREGITNNVKISERLQKEYGINLLEHIIKRRCKELSFLSGCYAATELTYQEKAQLVLDTLDEDQTDSWGVENVKARIASKCAIHLPKPFISNIMHLYAPDGFEKQDPGSKCIVRVKKAPIGIHERWAADSHDKLYSIGFPIWAIVDDATGKWLGAWVVPSNCLGNIIVYLFVVTIEHFGGIALQVSTDCGSETTLVYGLSNALRDKYHPEIDSVILKAHEYVRSVRNISVKHSWLHLRLDWGNNAIAVFQEGIIKGIYQPSDAQQYELVQWLWSTLLRQEVNTFMEFRNGAQMRKDSQKAGPSGMSRNDAPTLFESWGGQDCLLKIPNCSSVMQSLKEYLGGESLLDFVDADYAQCAATAYNKLGITQLTFENVWEVFQDLFQELYD